MEVFDHDQIIMNFFYDDLIVDAYRKCHSAMLVNKLVSNKHSRVALP
jgi:hypothetical protein